MKVQQKLHYDICKSIYMHFFSYEGKKPSVLPSNSMAISWQSKLKEMVGNTIVQNEILKSKNSSMKMISKSEAATESHVNSASHLQPPK